MKQQPKIKAPTSKEDTAIQQGISVDKDNPEWSEDDFARARPAREVLPNLVGKNNAEQLLKRGPGRPPKQRLKERLTIRLDADVVEWLKKQGPGYQTRINSILREIMESR